MQRGRSRPVPQTSATTFGVGAVARPLPSGSIPARSEQSACQRARWLQTSCKLNSAASATCSRHCATRLGARARSTCSMQRDAPHRCEE
eukprot:9297074-Alexandrium_andersonii.AAC.1